AESKEIVMKVWVVSPLALFVLVALAVERPRAVHAAPTSAHDPKAVKAPDTPAGRQLIGWLGALNTGKPETVQRFITENCSKEVLARGTAKQRAVGGIKLCLDNGGTPDLVRVERSAANELVALVQFPVTESWLRVSLKVAPEPPHTVTLWTVASFTPP